MAVLMERFRGSVDKGLLTIAHELYFEFVKNIKEMVVQEVAEKHTHGAVVQNKEIE